MKPPADPGPRRATALIRVSKVGTRGDDLISPDLQRTAIVDYAGRRDITVVEWVEALDESASRASSPWWRRLDAAVEQVEAGDRDTVLLWKFSRAARHRRKWAVALDRIETAGGTIESATEGVDTSTSTGRFTRGMFAEIAAWEADRIGEQWRETHASRLKRGLPHDGRPRFGYTYSRSDGYQPDPDTGPLLADLYRRYVAGEGFSRLTDWLNRNAVRTRNGKLWTSGRLLYLLDSGFAAGLLAQGHDRTLTHLPGAHPPLIDSRLWEAYRARRLMLAQTPARLREPRWPLSGLLRCGGCGATLEAYSRPLKEGPVGMYRCTAYANRGPSVCPGVWVRRSVVEQAVRDWLVPFADDVAEQARAKVELRTVRTQARTDVVRLGRELTRMQAEADRMSQAVAEGLPMADYRRWRETHDPARERVEAALLRAQTVGVEAVQVSPAQVRSLLAGWDMLPSGRLRQIVGRLVGRVEVTRAEVFRGKPSVRVVARWEL